jgi:tRNA-Thr(GGU) m(6)t(6)A37 methyltransferase TsaA
MAGLVPAPVRVHEASPRFPEPVLLRPAKRVEFSALAIVAAACHRRPMTEPNKSGAANTGDDFPTLRDGEVTVALPAQFDASLYFIGRIRTPWQTREQCPKNPRESNAVCSVELDARWTPALKGLETVSHVLLLYWMDRTRRDLVLQVPRHYGEQRGTFALRSPARPNPIAVSVAQLVRVEGNALYVVGVDCLDDTPLLDIKPYFASTDSVPEAVVGWHARRGRRMSDDR